VTPRYQEVIVGQRARVLCHYTGAKPYIMSWNRDDIVLSQTSSSDALLEVTKPNSLMLKEFNAKFSCIYL